MLKISAVDDALRICRDFDPDEAVSPLAVKVLSDIVDGSRQG
jgi:hypothetical protein